jgi:hypothetical protein
MTLRSLSDIRRMVSETARYSMPSAAACPSDHPTAATQGSVWTQRGIHRWSKRLSCPRIELIATLASENAVLSKRLIPFTSPTA